MKNFPIRYITFCVIGIWSLLASFATQAQDVSINVLGTPATLPLSTTGSIQIDLCNTDPSNVAVDVNKLNPQISVGSNVTILGVTNMDGSPLTNFTTLSNTGKVISLSNSASIPNTSCFSFKVIIRGDVVDTPGSVGGIIATLAFQNAQPAGNKLFNDNSTTSVAVTRPQWDLSPIIYTRPSVVFGTAAVTVVVDVLELKAIEAASGPITVKITRDPSLNLNFNPSANLIGDRSVQNSAWSFDTSDPTYYVLTTNQSIAAGAQISFGLNGIFNSNATTGLISISSSVFSNAGEQKLANNVTASKIEYFAH